MKFILDPDIWLIKLHSCFRIVFKISVHQSTFPFGNLDHEKFQLHKFHVLVVNGERIILTTFTHFRPEQNI